MCGYISPWADRTREVSYPRRWPVLRIRFVLSIPFTMNPDYIQSKLESIELGETLIAPWEDIFVWTEDCVRPSQLES